MPLYPVVAPEAVNVVVLPAQMVVVPETVPGEGVPEQAGIAMQLIVASHPV